ncbi:MAG: class I SAM-dependent methyltransferase [Candidatus Paceibacterota bacterium]|jgi:SAM-dependent methyltransferase
MFNDQKENIENRIENRFNAVARSKTFRNIVSAFRLDTKEVLDIGCSYGEHLIHFGNGGTGITINQDEATEGIRRGLDVHVGNIEEEFNFEKTYDAIYCNNLLEHLYSPHQFLYEVRTALKANGILILGVPVIPFPRYLMQIKKFCGVLASAHINFFTKDSLVLTVTRAGWKVREVRGFRLSKRPLDRMITFLYPHIYIVAEPDTTFSYDEKRQKELAGYNHYTRR